MILNPIRHAFEPDHISPQRAQRIAALWEPPLLRRPDELFFKRELPHILLDRFRLILLNAGG